MEVTHEHTCNFSFVVVILITWQHLFLSNSLDVQLSCQVSNMAETGLMYTILPNGSTHTKMEQEAQE